MVAPGESALVPSQSGEFEILLMPQLAAAYRTALRLTGQAADAEDLVQEAVLLACRGFSSFQTGTNFRAWFFRILTNAYFSKYRRLRRQGTSVELEDSPELYLFMQSADAGLHRYTDPAGAVMDRLDTGQVTAAIDALPEEYRAAAALYLVNDMAYDEIASTLGVPIGTVRSRLHRARRMLQRALWTIAEDAGIVTELQSRER